ncbi:hypothetical protein B0A49_03428 [Cryomyces minteri]|uniref:Xaa-Pro aminopeptidase n=1 Tax=Cryomyces minteri TaxID=331657 RepID=A0A4U0XLA3_9PEZI|nr:hypothetical protein B0A49_03428 [Cryomyces minteri]
MKLIHISLGRVNVVTPGISALEYHRRRSKLAQALPKNSIAVIAASDTKYRSGAVFYEFHQDPSFLYLTGFNEPEALAVIEKAGSDVEYKFHLFVRPKDPQAELWDGARSGLQAAQDVFNADEARFVYDINRVHAHLPDIVGSARAVYTDLPGSLKSKSAFTRYFYGGSDAKPEVFAKILKDSRVQPLRPTMNEVRMFKSEAEIRNMRIAGQASGRVYTEAMRQHFDTEKKMWNYLEYGFRTQGCDSSAYVPVVAGGRHALSIHYVRNDDTLKDGDLVLVDAGGEYGGYITDITRTWPVNGKFSDPQRDLYETILKVQRSCVALCREDADVTLDKLHTIAENGLRQGLAQIGFDMSGKALETLFPHHLGHYIGLDVHDSPGGIYVPDDDRWPAHFRGTGIRIEDSVCIQEESPLVLTTEAVKEVVDIEALRQQ